MTYCASIWTRATYIKHNATKIRRVQALALPIMTGAVPSTSFVSLRRLTNYTPDITIYLWGAKGAAKFRAYGSWSLENFATTKGTIKTHINTIFTRFTRFTRLQNT